jgi:hypothetical protein
VADLRPDHRKRQREQPHDATARHALRWYASGRCPSSSSGGSSEAGVRLRES